MRMICVNQVENLQGAALRVGAGPVVNGFLAFPVKFFRAVSGSSWLPARKTRDGFLAARAFGFWGKMGK